MGGKSPYFSSCRAVTIFFNGMRCGAAPAVASVGAAVHADANKVIFHGGYKVWDAGSEFEDFASTRAFDMKTGEFECLTAGTAENEKAALGQTHGACPKLHGAHTGKRDEEVAVITTKPIRLPKAVAKKETAHVEAALGKHLTRPELPAIDVEDEEDDATTSSVEETTDGEGASELGSESKQHAMIIFGGPTRTTNAWTPSTRSVSKTRNGGRLSTNFQTSETTWCPKDRLKCHSS